LHLGIEIRRRTTRLTRPYAFAVAASMNSPVSSISIACLRLTLRASATLGVEQNRPKFTPLTANFALSAATARSHWATSWQPAAVAWRAPWRSPAAAANDRVITLLHFSNRPWMRFWSERTDLLQVVPAQKPRPRAAMTTTRTLASSRCHRARPAAGRAARRRAH
jgi:hypothetical protein